MFFSFFTIFLTYIMSPFFQGLTEEACRLKKTIPIAIKTTGIVSISYVQFTIYQKQS